MSKYANAAQVSTPSRVVSSKLFLDFVGPLLRNHEFLKTLTFISLATVPFVSIQVIMDNSIAKISITAPIVYT